jgi:ligand-binding sensor domain-containing protein/uncharacterized protein YneF (UPF0154 family)
MIKTIGSLLFCLFSFIAFGQEPMTKNFTLKDGLPSNETYCVITDKKGYIWIATDAGISRYDGYTFKNFTEQDGLPDPVIFKLYEDFTGKIWFTTMNHKVGYILENKVFAIKVDVSKHKLHVNTYLKGIYVDENKTLWLTSNGLIANSLLKIPYPYVNSSVILKNVTANFTVTDSMILSMNLSRNADKFETNVSYFELKSNTLEYKNQTKCTNKTFHNMKVFCSDNKKQIFVGVDKQLVALAENKIIKKFQNEIIFMAFDGQDRLWVGLQDGGIELIANVENPNKSILYFPKFGISSFIEDKDGGFWFTSLQKGVFYIPSKEFLGFESESSALSSKIVNLIVNSKDELSFVGLKKKVFNLKNRQLTQFPFQAKEINFISELPNMIFISGDSTAIYNITNKKYTYLSNELGNTVFSKKIICLDNQVFCISTNSVFVIDGYKLMKIFDSPLIRIFDAHADHHESIIWLASSAGLLKFEIKSKKITFCSKLNLVLKNRIERIQEENGNLWLATRSNGILIYDKKNKISYINENNGLSSDFCRKLYLDDFGNAWLAGNRGISMIQISTRKVFDLNFINDFIHAEISDIKSFGDKLFLATGQGLFSFSINELTKKYKTLKVHITSVQQYDYTQLGKSKDFNYKENFSSFSFIAISPYNQGKIEYEYRLNYGKWKKTNKLKVEYFDLDPGNYIFQIRTAIGLNGINSISKHQFKIYPPYWKTWWFIVIMIVLFVVVLFIIGYFLVRRTKRKEQKNQEIKIMIAKLEAKALRSQMNPHFIFNALNSIQNFLLKNENKQAVDFLQKFSRLIRNILETSKADYVTIDKEEQTLLYYIQLEQMRSSDDFIFTLTVEQTIDKEKELIPSMIMQPFIENAILHGLNPLVGKKGVLKIDFKKTVDGNICIIEDNGIGRKKALEISAKKRMYHESMGMSVTNERLAQLNTNTENSSKFIIEDLFDLHGIASGTKVTIFLSKSI